MNGKPRWHWTLYGLSGYAVALAVQCVLMPPDWNGPGTMVPYLATPLLMLLFGPYLLVPQDAWIGSGDWWWLVRVLPLYLAHLAFFYGLLVRPGLVKHTRCGKKRRLFEMGLVACWSALGIWFAVPVVENHKLAVEGRLQGQSVRLAVVTDLHSCRYGEGQRGLVEMVESGQPDIILMVGDIFDDRLPDGPTQAFVTEIVKRYPCVYVTGNHEFWSDRVCGMKIWMARAGVTVLQDDCRTFRVKGNVLDVCGVDDPTEMTVAYWTGLLKAAYAKSESAHFRILLTHRPEYPDVYAQFGYDLVLAGHAHGGQWRCPFVDFGTYSPDQHFFPRFSDGFYRLPNGTPMFVSRGLARESSPVPRFFNHPEIAFIDIESKTENEK